MEEAFILFSDFLERCGKEYIIFPVIAERFLYTPGDEESKVTSPALQCIV
jgi:hypothetical protein